MQDIFIYPFKKKVKKNLGRLCKFIWERFLNMQWLFPCKKKYIQRRFPKYWPMARSYFGKKRISTALLKRRIRSIYLGILLEKAMWKYPLQKRVSGELFALLHRSRAFLDFQLDKSCIKSLMNSGFENVIISSPSV